MFARNYAQYHISTCFKGRVIDPYSNLFNVAETVLDEVEIMDCTTNEMSSTFLLYTAFSFRLLLHTHLYVAVNVVL